MKKPPGTEIVSLRIPATFKEVTRNCAEAEGLTFREYTALSLQRARTIREIGPDNTTAVIGRGHQRYPLPRLVLPPVEDVVIYTKIPLDTDDYEALQADCALRGDNPRNRTLRCLNMSNYLMGIGAEPPTLEKGGQRFPIDPINPIGY